MIIQKAVKLAMNVFEQKMNEFANNREFEELTAEIAVAFSHALKDAFSASGRTAYKHFIESYDVEANTYVIQQVTYRKKLISQKKYLTPFGIIMIDRSLYQADKGGPSLCPLDGLWGMKNEFATEEVRESICYAMAHLTAKETESFFAKCALFNVSATAIKNIANQVGRTVEKYSDILTSVQESQSIPEQTNVIVASMDGVNVLLRKKGAKQGRPSERPQTGSKNQNNSMYKNAMVGVVSCYISGTGDEKKPQRLQSRYIARMPQERSLIFKKHFEQELTSLDSKLSLKTVKVFLCDGHLAIWKYANDNPLYDEYEKLIDYYHTTEHLSHVSEALFGKCSKQGQQWYQTYREKLKQDDNAVDSIFRSIQYYSQQKRLSKKRQEELNKQVTFFKRNRHLMRYAEFRRRNLPIGSGPVEAACKSIVKTRLCRSGMRWSISGGQHILNLRSFAKSDRWDDFWKQYTHIKRTS